MTVSSEFTAIEMQLIREAGAAWNAALGTNAIRIWAQSSGLAWNLITKVNISNAGSLPNAGYGSAGWLVTSSTMVLGKNLIKEPNAFYNTCLHEFGHQLGLEHSSESPIMGHVLAVYPDLTPYPVDRIKLTNEEVYGVLAGAQPPPPPAYQGTQAHVPASYANTTVRGPPLDTSSTEPWAPLSTIASVPLPCALLSRGECGATSTLTAPVPAPFTPQFTPAVPQFAQFTPAAPQYTQFTPAAPQFTQFTPAAPQFTPRARFMAPVWG
jgi:hypothetical protein